MTDDDRPPARPWLSHYDAEVAHKLEYPRVPIHRLLEDTASRSPDSPCVSFFGRRFTYREIGELAGRVAEGARALGVRKGDRVALLLPNSPQFLAVYYGFLSVGAVVVPLNPLSTETELSFYLNDSGARTVVTIPLFARKVAALPGTPVEHLVVSGLAAFLPFPLSLVQRAKEWSLLRGVSHRGLVHFADFVSRARERSAPETPVDPDEMAVLIYSGGTTGTAKGIMLSHFACVVNAYQVVAWGHLDKAARLLAVLPLFHGFGMSVTMNAPVLGGAEIVLLPRFNARDVVRTIAKRKPTFLIGVPTMFVALSNLKGIERWNLKSLDGIFVGAAPLTQAVKEGFEARTGARMIEGYGLTEVVTACTANPYRGVHKLGSVGIPFPDVDAKIAALDDGRELGPGEQGEIQLRTPSMMLGYFNNADETREAIVDGWLHTGDIGYRDDDGYFYVTDRKKDLIIVGGFNVFPREIDEVIHKHPKVREGIAVGLPDDYAGERVRAYVVLKDGETATEEELLSFFRQRLVAYKVPSEVEFRSELPKSMIGKILRRTLREEHERARAAGGDEHAGR
ncbi:MAG: long-chain fatty acid--CoA ligase [Thermoanaerobaculia bacterium]|jgi:long-chain acyl-CoA synthetase